jgi:hypothetical protein
MSTGALIFAQNNASIDYTKLAVFCADRVLEFLKIPVSLVTDNKQWLLDNFPNHKFDQIIEISFDEFYQKRYMCDGTMSSSVIEWKNFSRCDAYELSPYETTILLDSDYVINSSILSLSLDKDCDIQMYKKCFDLASWRSTNEFSRINQYSIPFYWATVVVFKKSLISESFFNLVSYIKQNWAYFKVLYSIDSQLFRNDFAFSIASHIMNGKTTGQFITELPGSMTYIKDTDLVYKMDNTAITFLIEKQNYCGEYQAVKTTGIDMHIMNKHSLSRFIDGGIGV